MSDKQTLREQLANCEYDRSVLLNALKGVEGALADAGKVLCNRTDWNYGESVRQIVEERNLLRAELATFKRHCAEDERSNQ